jgi:hypothetical protein
MHGVVLVIIMKIIVLVERFCCCVCKKINDNKEGKFCKLEFDRRFDRFGHDRLIPIIMEKKY